MGKNLPYALRPRAMMAKSACAMRNGSMKFKAMEVGLLGEQGRGRGK
jgi:hypothetical protein